jgi:hypothetical protein
VTFGPTIAHGESNAKNVALQNRFWWTRRRETTFVAVDAMREASLLKSRKQPSRIRG